MSPDGRAGPEPVSRPANILGVQCDRDTSWRLAISEAPEDSTDHRGLTFIDLSRPLPLIGGDIIPIGEPASGAALLHPSPQTTVGFLGEIPEEQRVHRAPEACSSSTRPSDTVCRATPTKRSRLWIRAMSS